MSKGPQINIRGLTSETLDRLKEQASAEHRSTEKQALHILTEYVQAQSSEAQYAATFAARLDGVFTATLAVSRYSRWTPAQVAELAGESHANATLAAFAGEAAPTFDLADRIAQVLGVSPEWLKYGTGQPYPARQWNLRGEAGKVAAALAPGDAGLSCVHLLRVNDEHGDLYIVREYDDSTPAEFYYTPHKLSEHIGSGGEADLVSLFQTLKTLCNSSAFASVQSYLTERNDIERASSRADGLLHPLAVVARSRKAPWCDDIWDAKMFDNGNYWPGQVQFSQRILRASKVRCKSV